MSQIIPPAASWPAAPPTGAVVVAHPAWEEARNFVLDRASEGPVTVALVGAPGTGKTWLLRELAGCLGEHGFPTMMVMQGDLPIMLIDNAAILVDEALRMPEPDLDELLTQDRAVVLLADVERFGEIASLRPVRPVIVALRELTDREVPQFAADWLRQTELSPAILEPEALARLVVHSRGTVRLIVQLLRAAIATRKLSGQTKVTAADIDRAAGMQEGGMTPKPVATPSLPEPPPAATAPRRSATRRKILAATALAACVTLGWALWTEFSPPGEVASAPILAALPPLRPAETNAPALAVRSTPTPATAATVEKADAAVAEAQAVEPAPVVLLPPPADAARPAFSTVATLSPAPLATTPDAAPSDPPAAVAKQPLNHEPQATVSSGRRGGPGIVLLAQRGDTLESLYRIIYRDRAAPPFADMVAANPSPLKPGGIVVFPEPPGGWSSPSTAEPATSERGRRRP